MNHETRILFVAWQCPGDRAIYPVARLLHRADEPRYEFAYVRGVDDAVRRGFRPFYGLNINAVLRSGQLPAFLANRLMSPERPDYQQHIERLGLDDSPEPLSILSRSEGTKITDNLEVFGHPSFNPENGVWQYYGFCRGIRHINSEEHVASLKPGDALGIEPELINEFDARALLLLRVDQHRLGYVPHTLIEDLTQAIDAGIRVDARVVRVNPPPAPVQQRLLVRISVPTGEGFRPLSTPRYQLVSPDATQISIESLMTCN
jgi:hypothetical protein